MRAIPVCLLLLLVTACGGFLDRADAQGSFRIDDPEAAIIADERNLVDEVAAQSLMSKSVMVDKIAERAQPLLDLEQPVESMAEFRPEVLETGEYLEERARADQWPAETLETKSLPTTALTQDLNKTISIAGGGNWLMGESGFVIGCAIGKQLSKRLRLDVEFAHRSNEQEQELVYFSPALTRIETSAKISSNSIMSNLFLDWNNSTRFTPYGGTGIGLSFVQGEAWATVVGFDGRLLDLANFNGSDTAFAWQAIGGVSFQLGALSDLFVEYRFFNLSQVAFNGFGSSENLEMHNLMLGFRKKF